MSSAFTLLAATVLVLGMMALCWAGFALSIQLRPRASRLMVGVNVLMAAALSLSVLAKAQAPSWLYMISNLSAQFAFILLSLVPAGIANRQLPWRQALYAGGPGLLLMALVTDLPYRSWHSLVEFGVVLPPACMATWHTYRLQRERLRRALALILAAPLGLLCLLLLVRWLEALIAPGATPSLRTSSDFNRLWLWGALLVCMLLNALMAAQALMQLLLDLRELTRNDPLTQVLNRRAFQTLLVQAHARLGRGQPYAVVMLDMDRFKQLNDTLGHGAGDAALQIMVGALKPCVREMDALGRLGGEEFGVLLPHTDLTGAALVAERMRLNLQSQAFEWQGRAWPLSASFGVAQGQPEDADPAAVLARADAALYAAKRMGRNLVQS